MASYLFERAAAAAHRDDDVGRPYDLVRQRLGNSPGLSMPSPAIASTIARLIASAGSLPAERTWTRPSARG